MSNTQLQLIEGAAPPRPSRADPRVTEAVIEQLIPQIIEWSRDAALQVDDVRADLVQLFDRHSITDNGYELAKGLERWAGYSPNAELVEIFEHSYDIASDATSDLVREWVRDWNIQLDRKVGDRVTFKLNRETHTGVICDLHPETAEYTISVPSEGHIGHLPEGVRPQTGTLGTVIRCEDVAGEEPEQAASAA